MRDPYNFLKGSFDAGARRLRRAAAEVWRRRPRSPPSERRRSRVLRRRRGARLAEGHANRPHRRIGVMITHIEENGLLRFTGVGGSDRRC